MKEVKKPTEVKLSQNPVIQVPQEFYDELDKKSKKDLIGIIIQLSWEYQELCKAIQESENAKRIITQ